MGLTINGVGNSNVSGLPDWFVNLIPPSQSLIPGVSTNIIGIVGTATWGPVNAIGYGDSYSDFAAQYGPLQARKYDLGTAVQIAQRNGASNFNFVRVTDGTDVAATITFPVISAGDAVAIVTAINNGQSGVRGPSLLVTASSATTTVTITSKYTGTFGNKTTLTVGAGTKASTTKVTISLPNNQTEIFDNLGTASAVAATPTLTGGTDGATTVVSATLIGTDTGTRTGMYALRRSGVAVAMLADLDDSTTYATQTAFGMSEACTMVMVGVAGDTITNAVTVKTTAAIDSMEAKLLLGDYCYWFDSENQIPKRLVSPQAFWAGRRVSITPNQAMLNRPLYGIVSTQRADYGRQYSNAELTVLSNAGIDVITSPSLGGGYYSARIGHNTSSNPLTRPDEYTSNANFIALSISAWVGSQIGLLQTPQQREEAYGALEAFFSDYQRTGGIGDVNAPDARAYYIQLDESNNSNSSVALGIENVDIKVKLFKAIEKMVVNIEAGFVVVIPSGNPTPL